MEILAENLILHEKVQNCKLDWRTFKLTIGEQGTQQENLQGFVACFALF